MPSTAPKRTCRRKECQSLLRDKQTSANPHDLGPPEKDLNLRNDSLGNGFPAAVGVEVEYDEPVSMPISSVDTASIYNFM